MTSPSLLCIGNITIDETVQPDGRRATAAGGDAVFAALAARLVLSDVRWLAPVGDDLPDHVLPELARVGLRAAGLPRRDLPTVRNVVTYLPGGARTWQLLCSEQDFDALSVYPDDVPAEALAVDGILVSAMSLDSQCELGPWLREHTDATLYLDVQEDYLDQRDRLLELVATCDVFLPSEVEATTLAMTDDVADAARFLRTVGPRTVVVKRAERGCLVLTRGDPVEVAAERVEPVDSTGAGDAFCGAFAAAHLQSGDAIAAARAGARAGRTAISGYGTSALLAAVPASGRM